MKTGRYLLVCFVLFCINPSYGSIRLHIAVQDSIETALGKSIDSLWFCREAYESLIDGTAPCYDSTEVWLDSVYDIGIPGLMEPSNVFAAEIPNEAGPRNNYFVAGVADNFIVPESGEYTFVVEANEGMVIMIDNQVLTDNNGEVFLYQTLDENIDHSRGVDGLPQIREYTATVTLDQGNHDFTLFFWEKSSTSKASIKWVLPSSPEDTVVVPPEAFGERKNYGPLEAEWIVVGPYPDDDICAYAIYEDTGTVYFGAVARGLMPGETASYHWEFSIDEGFTGEPEITTTDSVFDTLLTRPPDKTGDVVVDYKFWFETSMGRSIDPLGGGSCHVVIFSDTSTAIQRPLTTQRWNSIGRQNHDLFSLQGKKISPAKAENNSGTIKGNQIYISKNKNSLKKRLLIK
ncbi:MAG: hypothetical protein GF401_01965 [Chitinivibrionales bacterium]|nr:hypothetical protein [Chitinivibrionales bacterium]